MQSLNINQLVIDGLAPLAYASKHVVHHILDMNISDNHLINNVSKLSSYIFTSPFFKSDILVPFEDIFQKSKSSNDIVQAVFAYSSFSNKNLTTLLRSALIVDNASFRHALADFKMTNKKIFFQQINQRDKHQYTLLWYLTIANLYSSIKELHRLAAVELNVNVKNGPYNQTILHYTVVHGNKEDIQFILDIGVDTNLSDRFSQTALHYIAMYGTKNKNDIEIAKLLIDYKILPNLEDNTHRTSLHFAIITGNYDLVEYLITLPNINVCIRDKHGYTPLCYLCERILNLSDISLEHNQCTNILERINDLINLILGRCPSEKLSDNFHILKNDKLHENLLLHVYNKLTNLKMPLNINNLFHRLESITIGTHQDHCLLAERLLDFHSWKLAIYALCNTHHVNISNALNQCIVHDPFELLKKNISSSSDVSIVFVLIFYSLATDKTLLQKVVPMCNSVIEDELVNIFNIFDLYIENYNLHTDYVTFIYTCLHYARSNVFSLKHLCRYHIRDYCKSHIIDKIDKCSNLQSKYRDYLKFNELLLIYSETNNLSFIIDLIQRLYNIHTYNLYENKLERSSQISIEHIDISSDNSSITEDISNESDTTENEDETKVEEIIVQSDMSYDNLSNDQVESKYLLQLPIETSIRDTDLSFKTIHRSILSFTDDEISSEQFENELTEMQTKSKDIEEMIDKFLLKK